VKFEDNKPIPKRKLDTRSFMARSTGTRRTVVRDVLGLSSDCLETGDTKTTVGMKETLSMNRKGPAQTLRINVQLAG